MSKKRSPEARARSRARYRANVQARRTAENPERFETKYGRQPAADLLLERGFTVRAAAAAIGVKPMQLVWPIIGKFAPTRRVVVGLCRLLDASPIDLFTPEILAKALKRDAELRAARKAEKEAAKGTGDER